MSAEARRHFDEELSALEMRVQAMGTAAQRQVEMALDAMIRSDVNLCAAVIDADDEVDAFYLEIEETILDLFALQTPVASDLRALTVMLHINLHLERIADMAVNMAKITALAANLPRNDGVLQHLEEMGGIALKMLAAAMDAFGNRNLALCLELTKMDEPIDRLNRGMLQEILDISYDKQMLEWGIRMHVVSRQVERIGDHAVDIGEQIAFLITGQFREFTDASH